MDQALLWARTTFREFPVFCAVGVINTVVGLGTILLLSEIFGVHYVIANICGYCLGLMCSFTLNKLITFRHKDHMTFKQIMNFMTVFVIAYGIQFGLLVVLHDFLNFSNVFSQIISMGFYTVIGFLGNKFLTFKT